jgi:glycosyltransferase involved in cell wall biosynthesis
MLSRSNKSTRFLNATATHDLSHGSSAEMVSVLIPAHNHELYIEECLTSVVADGYSNLEIVVLDDGSTDTTPARISRWIDEHPDVDIKFKRQDNRGVTAALNELLALASGKYVATLGSDDRLLPGGIEARLEHLKRHRNRHAVFGDCRVIDESGRVVRKRGVALGNIGARNRLLRAPEREIIEKWAVPGPVLLYERQAVLSIGGYTPGLEIEDWDLYLRLAALGWVAFIDRTVSDYRIHSNNTMRASARRRIAGEMYRTAARRRSLFHGRRKMGLIQQEATWRSIAAAHDKRWTVFTYWRMASLLLKFLCWITPDANDGHEERRR